MGEESSILIMFSDRQCVCMTVLHSMAAVVIIPNATIIQNRLTPTHAYIRGGTEALFFLFVSCEISSLLCDALWWLFRNFDTGVDYAGNSRHTGCGISS